MGTPGSAAVVVPTGGTAARGPSKDCTAASKDDAPTKTKFNPFHHRKRARDDPDNVAPAEPNDDAAPFSVTTRYTPLLAAKWLSASEILVAENPWLDIARAQTTKPIVRKKFGKN